MHAPATTAQYYTRSTQRRIHHLLSLTAFIPAPETLQTCTSKYPLTTGLSQGMADEAALRSNSAFTLATCAATSLRGA